MLRRLWWWLRAWNPLPGVWMVHRAEQPLTLDADWLGTRASRAAVRVTSLIARQPSRHERGGPFHKLAVELSAPVVLVRSPDGSRSYLLLDVELADEELWLLVDVLEDAGAIDSGYAAWCRERGFTSVPMPWMDGARRYPSRGRPEDTAFVAQVGEL